MGLGQAQAIQLLWRGFPYVLLKEKIMTQSEIDVVTKELSEMLDAQPPLKLSYVYNVHVAQKGLVKV